MFSHLNSKLSSMPGTQKLFWFLSAIAILLAIPITLYTVGQQQIIRQNAWLTNQSVSAFCNAQGKVEITVKFTNTEPAGDNNTMNVIAKDMNSGGEVNLGAIKSGETKTGKIVTTQNSTSGGTVKFTLTWTNRTNGATDFRTATYGKVEACTNPTITPTPGVTGKCPAGTELLFAKTGGLSNGQTVGFGGTVSSLDGSWIVESRGGALLANAGRKITVTFSNEVTLDTVLIYDNDPKSGEKPWSINGKELPVTNDNSWGPPFKLNQKTKIMIFDYGGDSPHFNICLTKTNVPTSTPKPSPSLTPKPTPKISVTPKPSSTTKPSVTPTLPACPAPKKVVNVRINCPNCEGGQQ